MGIEIGYNKDGELYIRSDGHWLVWSRDSRLDTVVATPPTAAPPAVAPAGAPADFAPVPAIPPQSATPPATPPGSAPQEARTKKKVRWPKPPPGVMAIIQAPSRSAGEPLHWEFVDLDLIQPSLLRLPTPRLSGLNPKMLSHVVDRLKRQEPSTEDRFLTVDVKASLLERRGPVDLGELEALLKDPKLGLAGIRLVFTPERSSKW